MKLAEESSAEDEVSTIDAQSINYVDSAIIPATQPTALVVRPT